MQTTRLMRLPGRACRFYTKGRCAYEEHLNPGYRAEYRCLVLTQWETAFDEFLRRAEAFRISEPTAAGLWRKRLETLVEEADLCADFVPGDNSEPLDCALLREDLCLARLPQCAGVCERYRHAAGASQQA